MRDILLIAGNGLAIDLRSCHPDALAEWDTSSPLSWTTPTPGKPELPLRDAFPVLRDAISGLSGDASTDFERLSLLHSAAKATHNIKLIAELRHRLAIAFAYYQAEADRVLPDNWPLGAFLRGVSGRLLGMVSFNYDLTLESLIELQGHKCTHVGVANQPRGIPITKPHGSIDYVFQDWVISGAPPVYPLRNFMEQTDAPIKRLPREGLLVPRYSAEIVVPSEHSLYQGYQWVKLGRLWLRWIAQHIRVVVIVGLSYWHVDRPEIDAVLDALEPSAVVVIVDPAPNADLVASLRSRGMRVELWRQGPQEVPPS